MDFQKCIRECMYSIKFEDTRFIRNMILLNWKKKRINKFKIMFGRLLETPNIYDMKTKIIRALFKCWVQYIQLEQLLIRELTPN